MRAGLEPVEVPRLGRMVLAPGALAHLFALAGLVGGWSVYRQPVVAAVLFVCSALLPVALVAWPRRSGGRLPVPLAAAVVAGVFTVSVALPAVLPPEARSSWQSWNWGTGAMTLLGLAAYLPTGRLLALAGAHAGLAVAVQFLSGGGLWRVDLVLVATLVPPLGAAQYLRFYADALRQRALAVNAGRVAEADRRQLDVVRTDGDRRLDVLRDEIDPLLARVAAGAPLPLDDAHARRARQLAEQLRAVLVAQRRTLGLPTQLGAAPVTVTCSDAAAGRIGAEERVWLAALLDLLARHQGWRAVHVVLDPHPAGRIAAAITAEGPAATEAAMDPQVRALGATRGARLEIDGTFLSIDADLHAMIGA